MKTPTPLLTRSKLNFIIEALIRLAEVCKSLGYPEDEKHYSLLAADLKSYIDSKIRED